MLEGAMKAAGMGESSDLTQQCTVCHKTNSSTTVTGVTSYFLLGCEACFTKDQNTWYRKPEILTAHGAGMGAGAGGTYYCCLHL